MARRWLFFLFLAILILSNCLLYRCRQITQTPKINTTSEFSQSKIAFLFLSRTHLPLEEIWKAFFNWNANPHHYSIYVHTHPNFHFSKTSFFYGKEIPNRVEVQWGNVSQLIAYRNLLEEALKDKNNHFFCLMSETCIPIINFQRWRSSLLKRNSRSIINACFTSERDIETKARYHPILKEFGISRKNFRKSSNWVALTRKHAELFTQFTVQQLEQLKITINPDEHFLPSLLSASHLENETTCADGFSRVYWEYPNDAHPKSYLPSDIHPEFFTTVVHKPISKKKGFSHLCSGIPKVCHFTARKFPVISKLQLLNYLDLILGDKTKQFDIDPWKFLYDSFRINKDTKQMYLIENNKLRYIPNDESTNAEFHITSNITYKSINQTEEPWLTYGANYPSFADGLLYRSNSFVVWYMKDRKRHAIPNYATFLANNFTNEQIKFINVEELKMIVQGDDLKSVT